MRYRNEQYQSAECAGVEWAVLMGTFVSALFIPFGRLGGDESGRLATLARSACFEVALLAKSPQNRNPKRERGNSQLLFSLLTRRVRIAIATRSVSFDVAQGSFFLARMDDSF